VSLFINDKKVGEGRVDKTVPGRFSADESFDVGMDYGSPVSGDYQAPFTCAGEIKKLEIKLQPTSLSSSDEQKIREMEWGTTITAE